MKKLLALGIVLLSGAFIFAEEGDPFIDFFSDDVPRYEGLAVGGHFTHQLPLGSYADFAQMSLGGGADAEITFPFNLPKNIDIGISAHGEFNHVLPKPDTTLKSDEELRVEAGLWGRFPFMFGPVAMAFQPEVFGGWSLYFTTGQNGATTTGPYNAVVIGLSPELRIMPSFLRNFEIELSPLFTVVPEAQNQATIMLGYKVGLSYHIQSFINQKLKEKEEKKKALLAEQQRLERERQEEEARLQREEEERKRAEIERLKQEAAQAAADEEERARIAAEIALAEEQARLAEEARLAAEAEAARIAEEERIKAEEEARRIAEEEAHRAEIAAWPSPQVTFTPSLTENLTPDGDGHNDSVTFTMGIEYVEMSTESWSLTVTDPQGNPFRTFKGLGALPESIEWNGLSDKGEAVSSKNLYTAKLSVVPDRVDRMRTGLKTVDVVQPIKTGLLLQVIVPEHEWKIVVQTIAFDPDAATFKKLSAEQVKANHDTLDEVAQQIKDHPGAKVIVEGYANNISGTDKENLEELIPLSQSRAEAIVEELVKRGINAEILTATGKGGANPLASRRDKANWWKNRRVEFKITK